MASNRHERLARAIARKLKKEADARLLRAFETKRPTRKSGRRYAYLLECVDALRRNTEKK